MLAQAPGGPGLHGQVLVLRHIGLRDRFDVGNLEAYPPGSVIVLPGNTPQFHWAKSGEYVTQVTAIGPLGLLSICILTTIRAGKIANRREPPAAVRGGDAPMEPFSMFRS